jgi:hypothetical protein
VGVEDAADGEAESTGSMSFPHPSTS